MTSKDEWITQACKMEAERDNLKRELAATIERCAQVVENWAGEHAEGFSKTPEMHTAEAIAAAIRALKET